MMGSPVRVRASAPPVAEFLVSWIDSVENGGVGEQHRWDPASRAPLRFSRAGLCAKIDSMDDDELRATRPMYKEAAVVAAVIMLILIVAFVWALANMDLAVM
jgi:hypothetical protein